MGGAASASPPAPRTPEAHAMAQRTYEELVALTSKGQSVIIKGQVYSHPDDLPKPEDLAEDRSAVAAELKAQVEALNARLAAIEGAAPAAAPQASEEDAKAKKRDAALNK